MRFRLGVGLGLVVLVAAALVASAEGQGGGNRAAAQATFPNAPSPIPVPESPLIAESERTDPRVQPAYGQASTVFTLTFTLRHNPGHEGVLATEYRAEVMPPPGGAASCAGTQPAPILSGTAGEPEEVPLTPPASGWCQGTYAVTVYLQRGPYCPPPQEGMKPYPCPEFATAELNTGSTAFTVGPAGPPPPMVTVPRLGGLKPRAADRRLRRRHLRVRYTALSSLCAGTPPHGRIILQQPAAGTSVPRGTRVSVQTSCGRGAVRPQPQTAAGG